MIKQTKSYSLIVNHYKNKKTERSKVPLINHINEGLDILQILNADLVTQQAFCLHPLVQNDICFDYSCLEKEIIFLAKEYKIKANSYLCTPKNDWVTHIFEVKQLVGNISDNCLKMFLAYKIQNQKDFYIYHYLSHPRSEQLSNYFKLWLAYLKFLKTSKKHK